MGLVAVWRPRPDAPGQSCVSPWEGGTFGTAQVSPVMLCWKKEPASTRAWQDASQ